MQRSTRPTSTENGVEIEADTPEEAGAKFEQLVLQRGNGIIDVSAHSENRHIDGHYRVVAMWDGMTEDDLMEAEAEIEGEKFVAED
jgi:hypothetical protein